MLREEWDLPQVDAAFAHWARQPPTHVLVAAYLGFKPPADTRDLPSAEDFERIERELDAAIEQHKPLMH